MSLVALAAPALLLYVAATLGRLILAVLLLVPIVGLAIAGVALGVLLR